MLKANTGASRPLLPAGRIGTRDARGTHQRQRVPHHGWSWGSTSSPRSRSQGVGSPEAEHHSDASQRAHFWVGGGMNRRDRRLEGDDGSIPVPKTKHLVVSHGFARAHDWASSSFTP